MFRKGTLKEEGIDITLRNNPNHVFAPNDWDMVLDIKFGKISVEEYKNWYTNLIRDRWESRRKEIIDLAKTGVDKEVVLKCFCPRNTEYCHAEIAASFLNNLIGKLRCRST
jgi:hypothetical protein